MLQPLVPEKLEVQTFEGTSWVGVVPFRMVDVAPRGAPALPAFPEVNLRLYVEAEGRPGVWFLSLDATNPLVVGAGRRLLHLPYHRADIAFAETPDGHACASVRRGTGVAFRATYASTGPVGEALPGSLEHWLTERYCLYAETPTGRLLRTEVHHAPWPLQPARAVVTHNELGVPHGVQLDGPPALVHVSRRIDVVAWLPRAVGRARTAPSAR